MTCVRDQCNNLWHGRLREVVAAGCNGASHHCPLMFRSFHPTQTAVASRRITFGNHLDEVITIAQTVPPPPPLMAASQDTSMGKNI